MIVPCPECHKRYQVGTEQIPGDGRRVRCSACGHVWMQEPDVIDELSKNPQIQGLKDVTGQDKQKTGALKPLLGWGSFGLALVATVGMFAFQQAYITAIFPQTNSLYTLLGYKTPSLGEGLAFTNTTVTETPEGHFQVEGNITNTSDQLQDLSPLRIVAIGTHCKYPNAEGECILNEWTLVLDPQSLLPGEEVHFQSSPYPMIQGTESIGVHF